MKLKTIFLCGHESLYGISHLEPLLESKNLNIIAIVVADHKRWKHFHFSLNGLHVNSYSIQEKILLNLKNIAINYLPKWLLMTIKKEISNKRKVLQFANKKNIAVSSFFDINDAEALHFFDSQEADLIISAAYPQIFSRELIEIPTCGCVNFHPSLLPKYRGAHPHFWTILNGDNIGGITAHFMTEKIDDGDIISQIEIPVDDSVYSDFYKKIIKETPNLISLVDAFFENKDAVAKTQDLSQVSFYKNDREIHRRIFWNINDVKKIHNLCRTEKAFCFFRNHRIKCLKTSIANTNRNLTNEVKVENGTIIDFNHDHLVVKGIDGCIHIEAIEENGRLFPMSKWIKYKKLNIGEKMY